MALVSRCHNGSSGHSQPVSSSPAAVPSMEITIAADRLSRARPRRNQRAITLNSQAAVTVSSTERPTAHTGTVSGTTIRTSPPGQSDGA